MVNVQKITTRWENKFYSRVNTANKTEQICDNIMECIIIIFAYIYKVRQILNVPSTKNR